MHVEQCTNKYATSIQIVAIKLLIYQLNNSQSLLIQEQCSKQYCWFLLLMTESRKAITKSDQFYQIKKVIQNGYTEEAAWDSFLHISVNYLLTFLPGWKISESPSPALKLKAFPLHHFMENTALLQYVDTCNSNIILLGGAVVSSS